MLDSCSGARARVLLAEDNRVNQLVARAMLESLGYVVDVVADGDAVVKAATRTSYLAVLMDCQIPVLDGYDATREIRRLEGSARHTPIIAVTASATHAARQRCRAAGMDDYLSKPLGLPELRAALVRWAPNDAVPAAVNGTAARAAPTTRAGPTAAPPALDPEVVTRLVRLGESAGEDLMGRLAVLFIAGAEQRVTELRDGLEAHDAVSVITAAHTLRGASANIGATKLARLATMLETHGDAGDLSRGAALLDAIESELVHVRAALGTWAPSPIDAA